MILTIFQNIVDLSGYGPITEIVKTISKGKPWSSGSEQNSVKGRAIDTAEASRANFMKYSSH